MTVEEAARDFGAIMSQIPDIIYSSMNVGANEFNANMQNRVFNQGKDIQGAQIGKYSPVYAEYRRSIGRQTAKVDLQLFGDLKRSVIQTRIKGGWAVKFANTTQTNIARKNERKFKGSENTIFDISQSEKEDMIKVTNEEFQARVNIAFKDAGF